tara:strand:+ start:604 stop:813 length:210 start_codon:yes stop_codon:yes gene_type:complete
MEIVFESENTDIVIEFESSVFDQNFSDSTEVCWNFQNETHSGTMASLLFDLFEDQDSSEYLLPTMRLRG